MGAKLCGCNNTEIESKDQNVYSISNHSFKFLIIVRQCTKDNNNFPS